MRRAKAAPGAYDGGMLLAVKRKLELQPHALLRAPSGQLVTFSLKPLEAAFLDAYTPTLEPLWRKPIAQTSLGAFFHRDRLWVLDRTSATAYSVDGELIDRAAFDVPAGMRVGGAVPVQGGLVVALEHDEDLPVTAPVIMRVSDKGETIWTSTLPMDGVVLKMTEDSANGRQTARQEPVSTWHCSYFTAGRLVASSQAVLAVYVDMPRSGIGMAYVVSLATGEFLYATTMGPLHHAAALDGADFIVGCQGYGAFETLRYDARGRVSDRWESSGHFVVGRDDIRVIEMRNDSGRTHVARLKQRGSVERGTHLPGLDTSPPCRTPDGIVRFFRGGIVYAVQEISVVERLPVYDLCNDVFATQMTVGEGCVHVCFTRNFPSSDWSTPLQFDSYLVRVDID